MKKIVLITLLFALFALPGAATENPAAAEQWQWKIDDIVARDTVGEFRLSPDGKKLAWTVRRWNLKEQKRYNILYVTHMPEQKNKKPRRVQLTRGEETISQLQWVPTGKPGEYGEYKISFKTSRKYKDTKPNNLWIIDIAGGEPYPVTALKTKSGLLRYQWINKNSLLLLASEGKSLYQSQLEEKKDTSEVVEDEIHRNITRLYRYDRDTKKTTQLTRNHKPVYAFSLSPDKQWATFRLDMSVRYEVDGVYRPKFFLMHLATGETREIFNDGDVKLDEDAQFKWAPDGSGFYAAAHHASHPRYTMVSIRKIYWYPVASGDHREVDLGWERSGRHFYTTTDGFIMAMHNGVYYKYARFTKKGDTWTRQWIAGDEQKNTFSLKLAENKKTMVYSYTTASQPHRYYRAELKGNRFIRKDEVMDIDSVLFKRPLAKREIITWKGALEDTVEGILYYPHKYEKGKKYPLILMIHGGPYAADMDNFSDRLSKPAHLMAERGAFILTVNYHGSSNYGLAFGESIVGHYYEYEIIDIERGVDHLIHRGLVDKGKLGIIGWSNGAILGTQLTVVTDRYRVASLGAGDVNWTSDYGNCGFGVIFDNLYFGGPPWEKTDYYIEKSPLFKLKKVTTPTLIFHGSKDRSVPYEQGWEYYRALQVIGKAPVRFISFPGEGHGPRKLGHLRRKLEEEIRWFEKYLFHTGPQGYVNGSLKKGSPLERLGRQMAIARVKGLYGIEKDGVLIPEVVDYKGKKVGRFEVTRAQWAAFEKRFLYGPGTGNYPVTGISFEKARQYVQWLSKITGEPHRLPTGDDAQTLYKKRGGNTFDYWAGYKVTFSDYQALLEELKKYRFHTVLLKSVGSFAEAGDGAPGPKAGQDDAVYDLGGNAAEWVEIKPDNGEPRGGSAWQPENPAVGIVHPPGYIGIRVMK